MEVPQGERRPREEPAQDPPRGGAAGEAAGDGRKREPVDASPSDRVSGIGFGPEEAPASDRRLWGLNRLCKVLMEVRAALREEPEKGDEKSKAGAKKRRARLEDAAGRARSGRSSQDEWGKGKRKTDTAWGFCLGCEDA
ncbi:hypothetical protein LZ30DRAFT_779717 [Colletotrichum cereale]|nr:hypothetical protein LZ30DRAFT_779717 [Colletotrichum cereale]